MYSSCRMDLVIRLKIFVDSISKEKARLNYVRSDQRKGMKAVDTGSSLICSNITEQQLKFTLGFRNLGILGLLPLCTFNWKAI